MVSGDSAGGNLALSLLLRLQSKGAEMPAAAVTWHLCFVVVVLEEQRNP